MSEAVDESMTPETRAVMEAVDAAFPDVGGEVTDAAEARRILAQNPAPPFEPAPVAEVTDRTIPGPEGAPRLPVRIYRPPQATPEGTCPTVVYFHGGGWVLCGLDSHDGAARALCREAGAVVISVDYRLAPEARFPAPVEDAGAAVRWAAAHIAELGGDTDALAVAGDSAGGNLAAAVTLAARDRGGPRIAFQLLIYPATDPLADTHSRRANGEGYFLTSRAMAWFGAQYFGPDGDYTHPYAAPLRADLSGLPPAHVVTAGCDPLCDEGRAYAERLRAAGGAASEAHFPGMFHGFFGFHDVLPQAAEAQRGAGQAIAEACAGQNIDGRGPA